MSILVAAEGPLQQTIVVIQAMTANNKEYRILLKQEEKRKRKKRKNKTKKHANPNSIPLQSVLPYPYCETSTLAYNTTKTCQLPVALTFIVILLLSTTIVCPS